MAFFTGKFLVCNALQKDLLCVTTSESLLFMALCYALHEDLVVLV
jgi:hypothetical protein